MQHSFSLFALLLALTVLGCELQSSQAREPERQEQPLSVAIGSAELRRVANTIVLTSWVRDGAIGWRSARACAPASASAGIAPELADAAARAVNPDGPSRRRETRARRPSRSD